MVNPGYPTVHRPVVQTLNGDLAADATGQAHADFVYPPLYQRLMDWSVQDFPKNSATEEVSGGILPLTREAYESVLTSSGAMADLLVAAGYYGPFGFQLTYSGDAKYAGSQRSYTRDLAPAAGRTVPPLDVTAAPSSGGTFVVTATTGATPATGKIQFACFTSDEMRQLAANPPAGDPATVMAGATQHTEVDIVDSTAKFTCQVRKPGKYVVMAGYSGDTKFAPVTKGVRVEPVDGATTAGIDPATAFGPAQQVVVNVTAAPNSAVEVWMQSTPVKLGELSTGADGTGKLTVTLPADATDGKHHFILKQGGTELTRDEFSVSSAAPLRAPQSVNLQSGAGNPGNPTPTPTPKPQPGPTGSTGNLLGGFGSSK